MKIVDKIGSVVVGVLAACLAISTLGDVNLPDRYKTSQLQRWQSTRDSYMRTRDYLRRQGVPEAALNSLDGLGSYLDRKLQMTAYLGGDRVIDTSEDSR